jgi:uncharacterized protein YgfB (UPF0149 family)
MTANIASPAYAEVAEALGRLGGGLGAADLHGVLTGYLCAGGEQLDELLRATALEHLLNPGTDASVRETIASLFVATHAGLAAADFRFAPLLPDAERPLPERVRGLLEWCQGFLGGLGAGGLRDVQQLSAEGREVLSDLAEIARTRVGFDADEEVDEQALAELVEYARMGALLLREDLGKRAAGPRG